MSKKIANIYIQKNKGQKETGKEILKRKLKIGKEN